MFSFGIFTTHLPYIAFVAFYAYFLIFGIDQAQDGKIKIAEHSIQIEQQLNSFQPTTVSVFDIQKQMFAEQAKQAVYSCRQSKHKWKLSYQHSFHISDYIGDSLFCRPPPAIA